MASEHTMRLGTTIAQLLDRARARHGSTPREDEALKYLCSSQGGDANDVIALEGLAKLASVSWRTLWPRVYERVLPTPSATPLKDLRR